MIYEIATSYFLFERLPLFVKLAGQSWGIDAISMDLLLAFLPFILLLLACGALIPFLGEKRKGARRELFTWLLFFSAIIVAVAEIIRLLVLTQDVFQGLLFVPSSLAVVGNGLRLIGVCAFGAALFVLVRVTYTHHHA